MIKNLFNFKLFKQGFKQLKVIGIISIIIYFISVILLFVNSSFDSLNPDSMLDINPMCLATYTVLAPIFTLYLFSFMTSRNSSDFFHSIPIKRKCLFTSYFAAIVAWLTIIHFSSTLFGVAIRLVFPNTFSMNYTEILKYAIGLYVSAIAVVCGIMFSQAITGTVFTNIIVTGIILFLPRLFSSIIIEIISDTTSSLIPQPSMSWLLTGSKNMITYPIFSLFTSQTLTSAFKTYGEWFYTIVLAIIYFSVAMFLFCRRKSEIAGNASSSNFLQAVCRISVTMLVCMIPIAGFCTSHSFDMSDTPAYITSYVIAIVVYFIYEIVTTRTIKRLVKIIPGLLVVLALNVVCILGINGFSSHAISNVPEVDDVKYISVSQSNTFSSTYTDYILPILETVEIKDKAVISTAIKSLNNYVDAIKSDDKDSLYEIDRLYPGLYSVKICKKNGDVIYRNIPLSDSSLETINKSCIKDQKVLEKISSLPDFNHISNISFQGLYDEYYFSRNATIEIYDCIQKEYAKLSDYEKLSIISGEQVILNEEYEETDTAVLAGNNTFYTTANIYIGYKILNIHLNPKYFPETNKIFIKNNLTNNKQLKNIQKTLEKINSDNFTSSYSYLDISVTTPYSHINYNINTCENNSFDGHFETNDNSKELNTDNCKSLLDNDFCNKLSKSISDSTQNIDELLEKYDSQFISIQIDDAYNNYSIFIPYSEDIEKLVTDLSKEYIQ